MWVVKVVSVLEMEGIFHHISGAPGVEGQEALGGMASRDVHHLRFPSVAQPPSS